MKTHIVVLPVSDSHTGHVQYISGLVPGRVESTARRSDAALYTETEAVDLAAKLVKVSGGCGWKAVTASRWIVDGAGMDAHD